jgi:hypothetical protein
MLKHIKKVVIIAVIAVIVVSCKNIVEPLEKDTAIYGTVIDENNNALADVDVHYVFYLGSVTSFRNILITYQLETAQNITIKIFDMHNNEIIVWQDGKFTEHGMYMCFLSMQKWTNGIYRYKITGESYNVDVAFPVLSNDISKLVKTVPLTSTNGTGEFKINYSIFGFTKRWIFEGGNEEHMVADSIKFVLHKEGYQTLQVPAKLDTTRIFEKTFKMIRNN